MTLAEIFRNARNPALLVALLAASAGCMRMGPDYQRPDAGIQSPESYQHASQTILPSQDVAWWNEFADPDLTRWVEQALAHNLDIRKAAFRILEIRAQFDQSRSDRMPSVEFQAQALRQRNGSGPETDAFSLAFPASFEIDLWGKLARAQEAAEADLLEAEENQKTLCQSIIAETASLYFQMESLERRIQLVSQSAASYRSRLNLVKSRYEQGLVSSLDLRQARRALAQSESRLPSLRRDLGVVQQNLATLAGTYPETRSARQQPADYFKMLESVPSGLPSDLLKNRPDIRAAEAALKALNARVGVAEANRFPTIALTGSFGYVSEELDMLLNSDSQLWNLAMGLTQPVFNAGRLKAVQKAAEARFSQGVAEYAKTIFNAFSEVERALLTRNEKTLERDKILLLVEEARAANRIADSRYRRGLVDYLTVLDAQQTLYLAQESLIEVELALLTNRIALHRAIGGAWHASPDAIQSTF